MKKLFVTIFLGPPSLKPNFLNNLFIIFFSFIISIIFINQASGQVLSLENEEIYVVFKNSIPSVENYVYKKTGATLNGDKYDETYVKIFYNDEFYTFSPLVESITQTTTSIIYHLKVVSFSEIVTFDLTYSLSSNVLKLVFNNIVETPNCKLMEVGRINLVAVLGDQQGKKLAFPHFDGVLIDLSTTDPLPNYINSVSHGVVRPLQLAMVYHKDLLGLLYYNNLDMVLEYSIYDNFLYGRICSFRVNFIYRYASNSLPIVFVDTFDSEIKSQAIEVAILSDYDGNSDIDWMDGAKFYRSLLNITPYTPYLNASIQNIERGQPVHISKMLADIAKVHNLIDGYEIIGYLIGNNAKKHPYYTAVFGVASDLDPDFASLDELKSAMNIASEKYNTNLTFYDNYVNYCVQNPDYDPAFRNTGDNGLPSPGWPYEGLECYIADPYDYAVNKGLTRVQNTVARYPIKKSQQLDGMSLGYYNDFSPNNPASREKNYRGSKLIIDEFNKYGINVTSEGLTSRFANSGIGYYKHAPHKVGSHLEIKSAEPIPLLEFIYHGKILYGPDVYNGVVPPEQERMYEFLESLLLGCAANSSIWSQLDSSHPIYDYQIHRFYLINLPWIALNQRLMQNYETNGSYRKVTYDLNTYVEIDYDKNEYTVMVDGRIIGKNYTTFYPKNENTFLIFSDTTKIINEALPANWINNPTLTKLTDNGENPQVSYLINNGNLSFNAEANTPYKLINSPISNNAGGSGGGGGGGGGGCFINTILQ
jgi:hypothetical protein